MRLRIDEARQQRMIRPRNTLARLEARVEIGNAPHRNDSPGGHDDRVLARCRALRRNGQKPVGRDEKIRGFLGLHRRGDFRKTGRKRGRKYIGEAAAPLACQQVARPSTRSRMDGLRTPSVW